MADPNAVSVAGVRYADVLESIQELFPPEQLQQRNAMSRTDGYWPFLSEGSEPPVELTYGEFDFYFFAELLDRAHSHFVADSYPQSTAATDWRDKVFVDIGSGTGRLVLSAAALHPGFKQCRGVELLESIHNVAVENLDKCRSSVAANPGAAPSPHHSYAYQTYADSLSNTAAANDPVSLESGSLPLPAGGDGTKKPSPDHRLAPIYFVCGSFEDPYINMGDADCIFVFSSCYLEDTMEKLGKAIGRQCRPGTIVITTERALPLRGNSDPIDSDPQVPYGPFEVQVVDQVQGYCWLTGGESTAFIHKVVSSQWSPVPVTRPL